MIPVLLALLTAAAPPEARKAETVAAMRSALHALIAVQPYLASPAAFADPANAPAIASDLGALEGPAHRFKMPGKQDQTLETLAALFGAEVTRARDEFKAGRPEATRARLQGLTALCFACHGRERSAKDFADAGKTVERLGLPLLRQAEFYATTRQFDRALDAWAQGLVTAPKTEAEVFDQAAAVRQQIGVLVRVKDDRVGTVSAIARQLARRGVPMFLRPAYVRWLEDAKAWEGDPFDAMIATSEALVAKARFLLEQAGLTKTAAPDEDRLIPALRAAGYLHAAIAREPEAPWRGEALFLLAIATATTSEPALWELDGLYLEACVRTKPHSDDARACVARYGERLRLGWTGSGGTRIPPDLQRRQAELTELAQ